MSIPVSIWIWVWVWVSALEGLAEGRGGRREKGEGLVMLQWNAVRRKKDVKGRVCGEKEKGKGREESERKWVEKQPLSMSRESRLSCA